jgi:hypothetical protein
VRAIPSTILPLITLEGEYDERRTPKFPGLSLIRSPSTHLNPALTNHRSKQERKACMTQDPESFSPSRPLRHHGVWGWPAILGARRYSSIHSVRQNFTSKAPPASLPPLDPIKGQAGDSTKRGGRRTKNKKSVTLPPYKINISSNLLCTLIFSL